MVPAGVDPGPVAVAGGEGEGAGVGGCERRRGLALRVWVNKRQHFGRRGGESIANALTKAGYWIALSGFFQRFPP